MIGNDATAWAHLDHHGAARECGCTPQEAGGRRLAHTRVTIKGRRGGSLPAIVAGIPTAPLAHTMHSTSRAVPQAVVSVVGACSAAREWGCTAASRRRSSARSCGSRP